jgi:hypothetical protein
MATSKRGVRGKRGVKGPRGRSGTPGPKGVGKRGPKGIPGRKGKTGKKGITGTRGKVGRHGREGTLAGSSDYDEILIVKRRIEDLYEGLTEQTERTAEMRVELDALSKRLQAVTKRSK